MNVAGWRDIPAPRMARWLGLERDRWHSQLNWDYAATLADVERARVTGQLPGLVAIDAERIVGSAYYLTHRGTLLIGHVSAPNRDVTRLLLDGILASVAAKATASTIVFGYFDAPGLAEELTRAGFVIEPYAYLSRDLMQPMDPPRRESGPYDVVANRAIARLLQGAYLTSPPNRPFAVGGTDPEWVEYVTQLTYGNGCGVFDQSSSVIHESGGTIDGVAIVSAVSKETAHLCQLAVHPGVRGTGLGIDLLATACARAKRNGRARMTLTVASSNTAALAVYRRLGFTETAQFTFASR